MNTRTREPDEEMEGDDVERDVIDDVGAICTTTVGSVSINEGCVRYEGVTHRGL